MFQEPPRIKDARRLYTLAIISIGLTFSNGALVALCAYLLLHHPVTVTPFIGPGRFQNTSLTLDAGYLRQMAEQWLLARFNITPSTVKARHERLLQFVATEAYPAIRRHLAKERQAVITQQLSSHFEVVAITPGLDANQVTVSGYLYRYVGERALPRLKRTYRLSYRYRWGKLTLVAFQRVNDESA